MKSGRVVAVSGSAGGIGRCLVRAFLDNGDTVIAHDMDAAVLAQSRELLPDNAKLHLVSGDISSEEDCLHLAEKVRRDLGRIDVLVNCAGWFPFASFEEIDPAQWRRVVDINLTGVFLMVRALLPLMKQNGWGRIINYDSGTFFKGSRDQSHYIAAKAGVIGLSRCLASELGDYNITVNVITPGLTVTGPVRRTFPPERLRARREERAIRRDEVPEDLVGTTMFLASPDADFITGQIINVDGGAVKH